LLFCENIGGISINNAGFFALAKNEYTYPIKERGD
jgi:hypothetical protein